MPPIAGSRFVIDRTTSGATRPASAALPTIRDDSSPDGHRRAGADGEQMRQQPVAQARGRARDGGARGEVVERVGGDEDGEDARAPRDPDPGRAVGDERVDGAAEDVGQAELGGCDREARQREQHDPEATLAGDAKQQAVRSACGAAMDGGDVLHES